MNSRALNEQYSNLVISGMSNLQANRLTRNLNENVAEPSKI